MGSHTAQQIHFIGTGGGNDQVGTVHTGPEQDLLGGTVSTDRHGFKLLHRLFQYQLILIGRILQHICQETAEQKDQT